MKTLYIFIKSDVPDVYINSIVHCVEHLKVEEVYLLDVVDNFDQKSSAERRLDELKSNIKRQLSSLHDGKYLYRDHKQQVWVERSIEIGPEDRSRYGRINSTTITTRPLIYPELENELTVFLKTNNNQCIFDVSAMLKGLLIDVYTLIRLKRIQDIHVFELKISQPRSYDEKELIHSLIQDETYSFTNLTKSQYTHNTTIEHELKLLDGYFDLDATWFARYIMTFASIFVLALWLVFNRYIVTHDWNKLEPWVFVLLEASFTSYALGFLIFTITQREFSFNPKEIFDLLKKWRIQYRQKKSQ